MVTLHSQCEQQKEEKKEIGEKQNSVCIYAYPRWHCVNCYSHWVTLGDRSQGSPMRTCLRVRIRVHYIQWHEISLEFHLCRCTCGGASMAYILYKYTWKAKNEKSDVQKSNKSCFFSDEKRNILCARNSYNLKSNACVDINITFKNTKLRLCLEILHFSFQKNFHLIFGHWTLMY